MPAARRALCFGPSTSNDSYISTLILTTYRVCDTGFTSWLRGAFSRNDPARRSQEWRPPLRREPQRREVRTPTARASWLGAGSRCRLRFHCRGRLRGSVSEIATVERRERSRSPRDRVVARRRRDRKKECVCRRSIHPSSGGRNCCCRDGRWCRSPRGLAGGRESEGTGEETEKPGCNNAPRERRTLRCLTS